MSRPKKLLLGLFFFVVLRIPTLATGSTYVVFRYDDLSADKPGIRQSDDDRWRIWKAEQDIDLLFARYGFEYVVSIIPMAGGTSFAEDPEKIELIKRAIASGRIEVAQHGLSHTNHTQANNRHSEFCERDYKGQLKDIRQGQEILYKSLDLPIITTFVPPWNGWDGNTARILKQTGFTILSADCFFYYKSAKGLTVIPQSSFLQELESVVNKGDLLKEGVIVVLYHPEDIVKLAGCEDTFFGVNRFDKLLHKLSMMPNVQVVTFEHLAQKCNNLTIERYRMANRFF